MHNEGILILIFIVVALMVGAFTKVFLRNSKLPYTVVLLLGGILIGTAARHDLFGHGSFDHVLSLVGGIDPHLILYLFLPTLIFESAYTMEAHLFFRILPQIVILAVFGLVISMVVTAGTVSLLLPWGVGLTLLFGALISATDPVAVVALLKEKSSRKRLETLVDGESLLNDGTAIVFFSIFYGFAVGTVENIALMTIVKDFALVVSGGVLIGVVIGSVILRIIGKIFNQPLIEIALSISAAYVTFIAAEAVHVSGVVALVSLALMFSTRGKTKVSPEVTSFLHQFWEMMAYIANTLIFIIVGIVIALTVTPDSPKLWGILILLYIFVTLIRAGTVALLMPVLKRIGVGITFQKAMVLIWGGLRGAVSLALVLTLSMDTKIPTEISEQMLFLTAGIVVLTIVINGSTMEWLLHKLQLDKLPAGKEASVRKAHRNLHGQMEEFISSFQNNPFFGTLDRHTLKELIEIHDEHLGELNVKMVDEETAYMRRLLEIERSNYWHQFAEGHIGRRAMLDLTHAVEEALDNSPQIGPRLGLVPIWDTPSIPSWVNHVPLLNKRMQRWLFTRLSLNYDIARGFVVAQNEIVNHVVSLSPCETVQEKVNSMIKQNILDAMAFTETLNLRYEELVLKLQLASARRLLLNHERSLVWKMEEEGVLEEAEAQILIERLEKQMAEMTQQR